MKARRSPSATDEANSSSNWSTAITSRSPEATRSSSARSSVPERSPGRRTTAGSPSARQQTRPQQGRLPAPGRPDERKERRVCKSRDELGDEPLAPAEELRVLGSNGASPLYGQTSRSVRVRPCAAASLRSQGGVLEEDRPLELLQLDIGLEPELVAEERARLPVDGESFCLPARPVEREHQLGAEPLAVGMLRGERLQLRHERELTAECELRVDSFLDRGKAQLLEALDLHPCEWLELEVGERAALPQRHRGAQTPRPPRPCRRSRTIPVRPRRGVRSVRGRARRARRGAGSRAHVRRAAARRRRPARAPCAGARLDCGARGRRRSSSARRRAPRSAARARQRGSRSGAGGRAAHAASARPPERGFRRPAPRADRGSGTRAWRLASHRESSSSGRRDSRGARRRWDRVGTRAPDDRGDALHGQVLLARCDGGRASPRRRSGRGDTEGLPQTVFRGALYLPGDELVLCLFDSASRASVKRASELAGMPCERVIETVWVGPKAKGDQP